MHRESTSARRVADQAMGQIMGHVGIEEVVSCRPVGACAPVITALNGDTLRAGVRLCGTGTAFTRQGSLVRSQYRPPARISGPVTTPVRALCEPQRGDAVGVAGDVSARRPGTEPLTCVMVRGSNPQLRAGGCRVMSAGWKGPRLALRRSSSWLRTRTGGITTSTTILCFCRRFPRALLMLLTWGAGRACSPGGWRSRSLGSSVSTATGPASKQLSPSRGRAWSSLFMVTS